MSEVRHEGWSGVENRRHRRVSLQVPIECRSESRVLLAKAENISISGLLVRCSAPFPDDREITVSFTLPGSNAAITTVASVAHVVPGVFMGLELTGLSPEARRQIDQYVAASTPSAKPK